MANKRMFTMKIVDSDAFLDMPLSTQCLYFHLNMRADDDGFVGNPKRIKKLIGAGDDDLKLLIAKRFILVFDNGVIVIKHWRMHNTLSKQRYRGTQYNDEKNTLFLKENGSYSLTSGIPIDDTKLIEMFSDNDSSENGEHLENTDIDLDIDIDIDIDKDIEINNIAPSYLENNSMPAVVFSLPLNNKTSHNITQEEIDNWKELYPAIDVMQQLRNMKGWLDANPTKRKTKSGINRFINSWLAREQNKSHAAPAPYKKVRKEEPIPTYNLNSEINQISDTQIQNNLEILKKMRGVNG